MCTVSVQVAVRDEAEIRGQKDLWWSNAGKYHCTKSRQEQNPLMLLDEIGKTSSSDYKGRYWWHFECLDPEHCSRLWIIIEVPQDLSEVYCLLQIANDVQGNSETT